MSLNPTNSTDDVTDEIPLGSATLSNCASSSIEEEDEVNALLDELKEPTEQELAIERLKQSTSKLQSAIKNVSQDIDSKLAISEKAKNVDSNFGISKTATSTASTIGSFFKQLQLKERVLDVANNESVRNLSTTVQDTLEKTGVKSAVVDGSQKIKSLDEEHKITTMTAEAIAGGVDWVAQSLNNVTGKSEDDYDKMVTEEK
jgi:molecular chaperone GrpE (heat shock protein)